MHKKLVRSTTIIKTVEETCAQTTSIKTPFAIFDGNCFKVVREVPGWKIIIGNNESQ